MASSEKLQYTLTLSTVSTGTGAREVARDMERVAAATSAAGDKAQVSQWGFYNLDEELKKTAQSSNTFQSEVQKVGGSSRNAGMGILMLSQGLEDAQYGMRGVLNNIPPMLMAFGMSGGVAGAVSMAAVGFSVLYEWLGKTEEKSSDVEERMQALGSKLENFHTTALDRIQESLQADMELANALKQKWGETAKAQDDYAASALDNATKLREIQNGIVELLGGQVDKQRELIAIAEEEAQKRRLAFEQAVAAEQKKAQGALEAVEELRQQRDVYAKIRAETIEKLAIQSQTLKKLKEEKRILEEMKAGRANLEGPMPPMMRSFVNENVGKAGSYAGLVGKVGLEAGRQLEDPLFKLQLDTITKQVEDLAAHLDKIQGPGGTIEKQEIAIADAATKAIDIEEGVKIEIARLEGIFQTEDIHAKMKEAVSMAELQAEEVKKIVSEIDTTNEAGKAAKATLTKAAEDGKITSDEIGEVAVSMQTLTTLLKIGVDTVSENNKQVLNQMARFNAQAAQMQNDLMNLQKTFLESQRFNR